MIGDLIVLAALAAVIGLAVCSMRKDRKSGGGCNGGCAHCKGCH